MAEAPIVELDAQDGVAWLRLNRPDALNALNRRLTGALEDALERVAVQDDLRVLVVAGRGRAFCAGNDIKEMEAVTPEDAEALARRHATIMARFTTLPQVTIAAVDGWALGGGLMLAIAQDLRVASDRARFGLPEVTLGFPPAYGIARLLDVVAGGHARDLLLTGRTLHATEALRIGARQPGGRSPDPRCERRRPGRRDCALAPRRARGHQEDRRGDPRGRRRRRG